MLPAVEEVESMLRFAYSEGVLEHAVFENNLLDVEKSSFVFHLLANLDDALPIIFRLDPLTVGALHPLNSKLDLKVQKFN